MGTTYEISVYQAADGWRWRMTASNGRKVADSGQAYVTRHGAHKAAYSRAISSACFSARMMRRRALINAILIIRD